MKSDKPPPDVAALLGQYQARCGKVYAATWCKTRGLLLTRQLSERLCEAFPYDVTEFKRQLGWLTFTKL